MNSAALPGVIAVAVFFLACWLVIIAAAARAVTRRCRRRRGGHRRAPAHAGPRKFRLHPERGAHRF